LSDLEIKSTIGTEKVEQPLGIPIMQVLHRPASNRLGSKIQLVVEGYEQAGSESM